MKFFTITLSVLFIYSCTAGSSSKRYEDYFPPIKEENGYIIFRPMDTVPGEDIGAYSGGAGTTENSVRSAQNNQEPVYTNNTVNEPVDTQNNNVNRESPVPVADNYEVRYATSADIASASKETICGIKNSGPKKIGKPYMISGVMYYPLESADGYSEEGIASWYGPGFHGELTANGETYNQKAMTAAHKTLPIPSLVRVKNIENGSEVIVRINDRGPFSKGRIIDLSEAAAHKLGMVDKGTARVHIAVLSEEADCYVAGGKEINIKEGNFAVQVAAFIDPANAEDLVVRLEGKAVISFGDIDGKTWNRVVVTGYKNRDEADNAAKDYAGEFPGAFVVRYR